ncbi:MAG: hypothetical protein J6C53_01035 [Clostridia bacterium]|nr:hypothetical protein [Clostridia bacterium]
MEIILKIIVIGLITCVATIIVKPVRSDFSIIIAIAGGIIIIFLIVNYLTGVFDVIKSIINVTGVNSAIYKFLIKIIAIGYLIEFTAGICSETGNSSLGDKVLLGGKIIIMVMSLPIITNILQIIMELLP